MLRELLTQSNLLSLPVISMMLFMAVFAGVVIWVFRRSRRAKYRQISMLPLDDADREKFESGDQQ